MLSVKMVAYCLSAVTVVMMSAPSTASWPVAQIVMSKPKPARFFAHLRDAAESMS